ncbi:MAG: C-terminal binding protein [Chloroflexota bacterium]
MSEGHWRVVAVNAHPDLDLSYEHEALRALGVEIERYRAGHDDEVARSIGDADVVVPMGYRIGAPVIQALERCRLIPSGGIGVDHIDVDAATARGILVTNMADTFVEEVANHAWLLLLMAAKRGLWLHNLASTNRWPEAHQQLHPVLRISMPRITGQTLGLISFGRIARATARRAQGFGMACLAYDPYVKSEVFAEYGVEPASLDEVCRRSDFVSCHLPLSKETFHLVGDAQFRRMKPTAIFISTGRGKVVDEAALIAALREGRLAGAGLDVLEQEPPDPANPLLTMPNVALSPHVASVSDVSYVERRRLLGQQIAAVLRGQIPKGVVNPAVLPGWRFRETS